MGHLTLVLGGQKSGKSSHGAALVAMTGRPVAVVTPAVVRDHEFAARVARHRADRPDDWRTIEDLDLPRALATAGPDTAVLVDALDTWLGEVLLGHGVDLGDHGASPEERDGAEAALARHVDDLLAAVAGRSADTVLIAGQPGLGPHAPGRGARLWVDLHGLVLQRLAAASDEVVLMVAGRPLPVPGSPTAGDDPGRARSRHHAPARPDPTPRSRGAIVLDDLIAAVHPADPGTVAAATEWQSTRARPPGSLGRLEALGVQLAGIAGTCPPPVPDHPIVVVAAADHGVHARGVSDWPQEVTAAMVDTVASGGATVNAIARAVGADVALVDVGTARTGPLPHGVVDRRVRAGTRDLVVEPAMTRSECEAAIAAGAEMAHEVVDAGGDLMVLGDLGIANTTASTCLVSAFTGADPATITGRGANRDDARVPRKVATVRAALERHGPGRDPLVTLASLGGLEHAALVGVVLAAAARRVPVVLDGLITDAAALAAAALAPAVTDHLVAGHRTAEPAGGVALDHLGIEPLLDLGLCLGEGTGGLLAVPLVRSAARALDDVASLDDVIA